MDKNNRQSILKTRDEDAEKVPDGNRRVSFAGRKSIKTYQEDENNATIWNSTMQESASDMSLENVHESLNTHNSNRNVTNIIQTDMSLTQDLQNRDSISRKKVSLNQDQVNGSVYTSTDMSLTQDLKERYVQSSVDMQLSQQPDETEYITNTSIILYESPILLENDRSSTYATDNSMLRNIRKKEIGGTRLSDSTPNTSSSSSQETFFYECEAPAAFNLAQKLQKITDHEKFLNSISLSQLKIKSPWTFKPVEVECVLPKLPPPERISEEFIKEKEKKLLEIQAITNKYMNSLLKKQEGLKQKSLEELLEDGRSRWNKSVIVERTSDNLYEVLILFKSIKLVVKLDDKIVDDFEMFPIFTATARPVGRYINTLFRRQFTKENLNKALGQKYDLISYIDYGYHLLEEKIQMFKTFEKIYVACNLTITDDFKFECYLFACGKVYSRFFLRGDLSNFKNIPPETIDIEILIGPVLDVTKVRELARESNDSDAKNCFEILHILLRKLKIYQKNIIN